MVGRIRPRKTPPNPYLLEKGNKPQVDQHAVGNVEMRSDDTKASNRINTASAILKDSTRYRNNTAENLYDAVFQKYMTGIDLFRDIKKEDIVADNVTYILTEYFSLLIKHPIPKKWHISGLWEDQEKPKIVSVDSIMKYVDPLYALLKS